MRKTTLRWVTCAALAFALCGGCASHAPKPGEVVAHYDGPTSPSVTELKDGGQYGCYRAGLPDPIEIFSLKKGQRIGFEVLSPDEGRGQMTPKLYGVAGAERFLLPQGEKYEWRRM